MDSCQRPERFTTACRLAQFRRLVIMSSNLHSRPPPDPNAIKGERHYVALQAVEE